MKEEKLEDKSAGSCEWNIWTGKVNVQAAYSGWNSKPPCLWVEKCTSACTRIGGGAMISVISHSLCSHFWKSTPEAPPDLSGFSGDWSRVAMRERGGKPCATVPAGYRISSSSIHNWSRFGMNYHPNNATKARSKQVSGKQKELLGLTCL